jgi:NAD(P)-dependent dehydrogenase (short-subunit alcohol dehydrogenase family)
METGPEMLSPSRIVLITGASRGIGAAVARLAAVEGYDVAVNYLRNKQSADVVVADIERAGRRGLAVQADVAREGDVERLFAAVDARLGRLTHLVCNTGITGPLSRTDALPISSRCDQQ